nr:MAG TPA: hypothetical protein [Caudoviricetes sp.]
MKLRVKRGLHLFCSSSLTSVFEVHLHCLEALLQFIFISFETQMKVYIHFVHYDTSFRMPASHSFLTFSLLSLHSLRSFRV